MLNQAERKKLLIAFKLFDSSFYFYYFQPVYSIKDIVAMTRRHVTTAL